MLCNRPFLLLWLVTISTTPAIELLSVGTLVTVFERTGATLQATGTLVARTLAVFLLGPMAGVPVDRFPRETVLVSADLVRVLLAGVAEWLLQRESQVPVAGVYRLLVGLSEPGVLQRSASLALIPTSVRQA
jgi:hypothetical protein